MLFEFNTLGGGQTGHSQGIIHGGMKYALTGKLTQDAEAMAAMPMRWQQSLAGLGECDLSRVPILSNKQYMWSPRASKAKLMQFLANSTLQAHVEPLTKESYPSVFQHPDFKGHVFAINETVLDVPVLIRELANANQNTLFKIEDLSEKDIELNEIGHITSMTLHAGCQKINLSAQRYIFTAGTGNEIAINRLNTKALAMQRRPLHMVMVKLPFHAPLYAHCLNFSARPRLTVTTHYRQDGSMVWYLGGLLAEEGVQRNKTNQIAATKQELNLLFPWLDFSTARFETIRIDRAEPLQADGLKPITCFTKTIGNTIIAWPTKLALAPKLTDDIMQQLQLTHLTPCQPHKEALAAWPHPSCAIPPWEIF